MKERLAELIVALRQSGVPVSIAESIDAAAAVAAAGVARDVLREALAATLVKDERDRATFLVAFERLFPSRPPPVPRRRHGRPGGAGEPMGAGGSAGAGGTQPGARPAQGATSAPPAAAARGSPVPPDAPRARPRGRGDDARRVEPAPRAAPARGLRRGVASERSAEAAGPGPRARAQALSAMSFHAMSPRDVEEAAALARVLARRFSTRMRRRLRPRKRGRLDFRRTIRAAVPHGGVLAERRYRGRRPGKPRLVALCDLSASVARATDFFLTLLAPAAAYFSSVRLFGFVDRPVEIEFVDGQVRPAGRLDLMARSDFGRVLVDFMAGAGSDLTADTLVLVLGDARNNRRPPRADQLALLRSRVRRVLWLNPDPRERWDTGDSVIASYARHVDLVAACGSLAELDDTLALLSRL